MTQKAKTMLLVFVFAHQLRAWIRFARDLDHVTREVKYLTGIVLSAVENLLRYFFDQHTNEDEVIYEHSVTVSELVEKIVSLEDDDIKRVMGLVDKIKRERSANPASLPEPKALA